VTTGLAALLLAVLTAATPDTAGLLRELAGGTPAQRRAAAERLAEVGDSAATGSLVTALRDTDADVRTAAQDALWAIWHRSGNAEADTLLQRGIAAMEERQLQEAVLIFTETIDRLPSFAEGWNKRATVYYLLGEFDRSLADCEEVIRRNPIHFGALSGFGLIYLQKDDLSRAAQYFERALAVNPNLDQIRAMLEQIREVLRQRRRQSI